MLDKESFGYMEEFKNLPNNPVWDMLCLNNGVPVKMTWIETLKESGQAVQFTR